MIIQRLERIVRELREENSELREKVASQQIALSLVDGGLCPSCREIRAYQEQKKSEMARFRREKEAFNRKGSIQQEKEASNETA